MPQDARVTVASVEESEIASLENAVAILQSRTRMKFALRWSRRTETLMLQTREIGGSNLYAMRDALVLDRAQPHDWQGMLVSTDMGTLQCAWNDVHSSCFRCIDTINVAGYDCIASLGCYGHSAVEEATKGAVEDAVQSETIAAKVVPAADRAVNDAATRTQNKSLAYVHRELLLDISEWLRFLCQSQVSLGQFERHVIILTYEQVALGHDRVFRVNYIVLVHEAD